MFGVRSMVLNLKRLYNNVGEKQDVDFSVDPDRLKEVKQYSFISPVSVKGSVYDRAGVVILDCVVDYTLDTVCDRCLKPLEKKFSFRVEHILVRETNTDSDEYIVTSGDELDLDELVIQDILLQIPSKLLCREDCKGICPICGTDLNINECNCKG